MKEELCPCGVPLSQHGPDGNVRTEDLGAENKRLREALEAIAKVAAEANAEADSNEGDYYAGGTIGAGFADAVADLARAALGGGGDP